MQNPSADCPSGRAPVLRAVSPAGKLPGRSVSGVGGWAEGGQAGSSLRLRLIAVPCSPLRLRGLFLLITEMCYSEVTPRAGGTNM